MEFWALVVGLALIAFFVPEIKAWTDRPRPPDQLDLGRTAPPSRAATPPSRRSIPGSAITLALRVVPGITRRSAVIAAGILLTALIGLTRVYLRVHWLSDVTSGWALGVSCFSRRSRSWCW